MDRSSSPGGSSAYLENLMQAGQQSMKQFDDALTSAMGVEGILPRVCLIAVCRCSELATAILGPSCRVLERHSRQQIRSRREVAGSRQALSGRGLATLALLPAYQEILFDDLGAID